MKEIIEALSRIVEETIGRFAKLHPGCRYALDCNADYGNVYIAVDTSPKRLATNAFFSEIAEDLYSFGDWPIPDLLMEDAAIDALWQKHWSNHEKVIRDDWLDLPDFEQIFRRNLFLQGVCAIAADLSARLPNIVSPILAADHDEHIRRTTARLRWAFEGPPTPLHALLADGRWLSKEVEFEQWLCFFQDQQFINYGVLLADPSFTIESSGDWSLSQDRLVMTLTDTNWTRLDQYLWKDVPYHILSLNHQMLSYREEDGTIWRFEQNK